MHFLQQDHQRILARNMNRMDPKTNDDTNDYMQENDDDASQEQDAIVEGLLMLCK